MKVFACTKMSCIQGLFPSLSKKNNTISKQNGFKNTSALRSSRKEYFWSLNILPKLQLEPEYIDKD